MFQTAHTSTVSRRILLCIVCVCIILVGYAVVLQHVEGLMPCPMCIVQRYAFTAVALFARLAWLIPARARRGRAPRRFFIALTLLSALGGAFVAARQSWLQWNPPPFMTCGRDFYSMIADLELSRSIPLIFQGSGDCAKVDWSFMGLTIANYSFLSFALFCLALWWAWKRA